MFDCIILLPKTFLGALWVNNIFKYALQCLPPQETQSRGFRLSKFAKQKSET